MSMDEPFEDEPFDEDEVPGEEEDPEDRDLPMPLTTDEREGIEGDLEDLDRMRDVFAPQGAKGVVINCTDCGENHYYGWDLLKENLEHMLDTGEPRMVEPQFAFCPRCGRSLAPVRLYQQLVERGMEEQEARVLLVRAGFEPFS